MSNYTQAEALKSARCALKLTQAEVAAAIGIEKRQYQRYEAGDREPRARTANSIARVLRQAPEQLFGFRENHRESA